MIGVVLLLTLVLSDTSHRFTFHSPDDPLAVSTLDSLATCRENFPEQPAEANFEKNRLEGFRLTGTYYCPRTLFEYGERDSFVDYVVKHSEGRAKGVAQTLRARLIEGRDVTTIKPINLIVIGDDAPLVAVVKAVFINELAQVFDPSLIAAAPTPQSSGSVLQIRIRRLQDPVDCFSVRLLSSHPHGGPSWSSL